jgi:O-succinylbenzoate synthase
MNFSTPLTPFLQKPLSLSRLELLRLDIPQKLVFQSAIGERKSKQVLIVRWEDGQGHVGYGECSARPDPYYSAEFLDGSVALVEKFIFPLLSSASTFGQLHKHLQKVRGWPFTKAAIEYAAHDLIARRDGESLFDYWPRPRLEKIPIGISLGIQPDHRTFEQVVEDGRQKGYQRLKFKIAPGMDQAPFAKLQAEKGDLYVSFDANGTFRERDLSELQVFTTFGTPVEQAFPPHRCDIHQAAQARYPQLKICLDEEVKGIGDLIKAHQLKLLDELNLKPGRVGGLLNSISIAEYCLDHGLPCWVGGMFETGIGRALNVQVAARLPLARAHDLSPSSRYFARDIVAAPLTMDETGFMNVPDQVAVEVDEAAVEAFCVEKRVLQF